MAKKIKKLKKDAKNIGGTLMPNGAELDPNKELCLIEDDKKGQEAYYKGQKMNYLDYYAELADREIKVNNGKSANSQSLGTFAGWGEGTLKKSYMRNKSNG
tara:strand:- start:18 stop:320 length:303 start_codon:yes stop_codon:yes gene_type:complete